VVPGPVQSVTASTTHQGVAYANCSARRSDQRPLRETVTERRSGLVARPGSLGADRWHGEPPVAGLGHGLGRPGRGRASAPSGAGGTGPRASPPGAGAAAGPVAVPERSW